MSIIVSVVPKWRFDAVGATVPETWEMVFVDAEDDVALREACKGADVLLAPSGFQKVTADLLRRNPHLKLVQASGRDLTGWIWRRPGSWGFRSQMFPAPMPTMWRNIRSA